MQEILERVDKIREKSLKRMNEIYEWVIYKKKQAANLQEEREESQESQKGDSSSQGNGKPVDKRNRKLYWNHDHPIRSLLGTNPFANNQQNIYDFGEIDQQEQNFHSMQIPGTGQGP